MASMNTPSATHRAWWRDAVIYQVYVRSFADADGDGREWRNLVEPLA